MEPSWHSNRMKNRCQVRKAIISRIVVFPKEKQWFWGFGASKLDIKINLKSIRNWRPRWIASWHRFLVDFGGLWEATWDAKSSQERKKIDWKTHRKNNEKKISFGGLQGGDPRTGHGDGWILGPPNYQVSKTTPHHSPQTTAHRPQKHLVTPSAQQRGGGY